MKVSIKGLVFTGFAAAILSANAMAAGENIVTSKSYVDAKINNNASYENISSTSRETAPNEKQVYDALATKQSLQSDASYKVGYNGGWVTMESAVKVPDNGSYLSLDTASDGSVTLNIDTTSQLQTDGSSLSSESGKLITEGAVAEAIAANGGAVNTGVLTVTQNSVPQGTFNANDATSPTIAIAAPDWTQTSSSAADFIKNKPTIVTDGSDISTASSADTTVLPTAFAVQEYADAKVSSSASISSTSTTTAPNESAVYSELATKENVSNKINTIDGNSDSAHYPSAAAVYNYVQSQTGGTVIPGKAALCNTYPCALVNDSTGAHWRTMATSGHDGGVLADYCDANNSCSVGNCTDSRCVEGA